LRRKREELSLGAFSVYGKEQDIASQGQAAMGGPVDTMAQLVSLFLIIAS